MFYIVVFMCLLIASIYQLGTRKQLNKLYYVLWVLLTVMLCFRYAQGTDYTTYEMRYYLRQEFGFEKGYCLLTQIFRTLHMDFPIIVMCIGMINMLSLNRFIKKYSNNTILSLLIAYPTLYLTYFYSAIRQGIAISFFLGFMIECLEKKKYVPYYLLALVATAFHKSSVIFLVIPIAIKFKERNYFYLLILAGIFASVSGGQWFRKILVYFFGGQGAFYTKQTSFFLWGTLERCVLFALVCFLYHVTCSNKKENQIQDILYKIYFIGFIGNIAFSQYFSGRLFSGFKLVEVVLLANLIGEINQNLFKWEIMVLVSGYLTLMIFKNLTAYIYEGAYNNISSPLEFPYISILNKESSLARKSYKERVELYRKRERVDRLKADIHWSLPGDDWDWFVNYEEN